MGKAVLLGASAILAASGLVQAPASAQDVAQNAVPSPTPSADAGASPSQAGIGDIVVTATRTGASQAQKTPLAISVFSSSQLSGSRIDNVKDLVSFTPNLNVGQASASAAIYIRGIGSNNVFNGSDPDVTVQSDGVYIARAFGQFADFIDVDRIEVLRGPQGTLYGRNAVGGTINIISRKPTDHFTGEAQLTGGNYGLLQGQGYISGPIAGEVLTASLSGNYTRHNGYIDNVLAGADSVGEADHGGLRGQLRFAPNEKFEAITRADWSRGDERIDAYSHLLTAVPGATLANSLIGDYYKTAINSPQVNRTRFWGISQDLNYNFDDVVSLKSLTAYRRSSYAVSVDSDGTELNALQAIQSDLSKQFSQELDLNIHTRRLDAVLGAYYFQEHELSEIQSNAFVTSPAQAPRAAQTTALPNAHSYSKALFAQGTYEIVDGLRFTAGIRYTSDKKQLDQFLTRTSLNLPTLGVVLPPFPITNYIDRHFQAWTPKFGLDYQVTNYVMLYGAITRGFKSGGTNFAATNKLALSFDPETIWSYEAGLKSDWLDHRLRVNLTGFYYDYKNLQVQALLAPGVAAIGNAASAKIKGLELETIAKPFKGLQLTFNYALLDSRYGRFKNAAEPPQLAPFLIGYNAATGTIDASGNRLNAAPHQSISASAQYDYPVGPGSIFLRGEYYWQSRAYYDPSNVAIMSQKPYSLVNLSVGYADDKAGWSAKVIAKNVANTKYLITTAANGLVPAGIAGTPRTIAFQLTKKW